MMAKNEKLAQNLQAVRQEADKIHVATQCSFYTGPLGGDERDRVRQPWLVLQNIIALLICSMKIPGSVES